MPSGVRLVVAARALRGFADGFVSVVLARYLTSLHFSPLEVGAIVTGTLLGSAVLTLAFGLRAHRVRPPVLLVAASVVMVGTGAGFAALTSFWPLLAVAVVGTLNPSAGDVSVFLPTEQALLASEVDAASRPRRFAVYNLAGTIAGAFGALASGVPDTIARASGWSTVSVDRWCFVGYAVVGLVIAVMYRRLAASTPDVDPPPDESARRPALRTSRRTVLELSALFSLDSAGSGFVVTSLLVLWLHLRFDLSAGLTGGVFFAAGVLGGCSQLLAPRLAARVGLIRTMAFTHIPANALLALAAFAPNGGVAIALLLTRSLFAQMDAPARQSFVMAVVPPEERAAASSVTNVPRSLASATTPLIAGSLLDHSSFGWPLLIAGVTKITYDLVLLALYRNVPEIEGAARTSTRGRAAA